MSSSSSSSSSTRKQCSSGVIQGLSQSVKDSAMYSLNFSHRLFRKNCHKLEFSFEFCHRLFQILSQCFFLFNFHTICTNFQGWRGFQIENFQPGDWSETIVHSFQAMVIKKSMNLKEKWFITKFQWIWNNNDLLKWIWNNWHTTTRRRGERKNHTYSIWPK